MTLAKKTMSALLSTVASLVVFYGFYCLAPLMGAGVQQYWPIPFTLLLFYIGYGTNRIFSDQW